MCPRHQCSSGFSFSFGTAKSSRTRRAKSRVLLSSVLRQKQNATIKPTADVASTTTMATQNTLSSDAVKTRLRKAPRAVVPKPRRSSALTGVFAFSAARNNEYALRKSLSRCNTKDSRLYSSGTLIPASCRAITWFLSPPEPISSNVSETLFTCSILPIPPTASRGNCEQLQAPCHDNL